MAGRANGLFYGLRVFAERHWLAAIIGGELSTGADRIEPASRAARPAFSGSGSGSASDSGSVSFAPSLSLAARRAAHG